MARRELAAACTLIGALGGALFGFVWARNNGSFEHWRWELVVALTICTAISATLLGLLLVRRRGEPASVGRAARLTFLAGALNGALMIVAKFVMAGGVVSEGFVLMPFAAAVGAVCAIPFAPAIMISAATASWVDTRPSSIAARSQGRRVLRNATLCLAFASVCVLPKPGEPLTVHLPLYIVAIAFVAAAALLLIDAAVLFGLRTDQVAWEPVPDGVIAERTLDYGVGLEFLMRRAHDETYREGVRATEVRHGNVDRARQLVVTSIRGHALAALTTGTALLLTIASN